MCESLFHCDNIVQDARDQWGAGGVLGGFFFCSFSVLAKEASERDPRMGHSECSGVSQVPGRLIF